MNDPVLDQEVNQNEENIAQLKAMAEEAGWIVSPKVVEGERITPLTKEEIDAFKIRVKTYSDYPRMQKEREI
ncbi:hypothetical protein DXA15_01940 [Parabacteroides sp. AM58-2XD]|uniref:hypothetical protein n=1 Tax=Parabacteroides TaxID=375288 RepID=UPI000FE21286|nr:MULTISPECIES: hypothetical protein [Parabacteroides]MCM0718170.1 hypothetical protein [Parabacteroides sp. W1-Q-101]RGZ02639.1 hypothetical protein DXA15_01940 [Parabacteroides sp. AM58-2XD]GKG73862.1 hypothetical protein CE91St1_30050 [Parabacteroides goldsteinii]GKG79786.1 hypothetical protein CE91St2_29780 [Parabacteroides goldsteinii]